MNSRRQWFESKGTPARAVAAAIIDFSNRRFSLKDNAAVARCTPTPRCCAIRLVTIAALVLGVLPATTTGSPFYHYTIVAQSGDGTLERIDPQISINDSGTVVFAGPDSRKLSSNSRIWMAKVPPTPAYEPISPDRDGYWYFTPQINNGGTVVYQVATFLQPH